ACHPSSSHASGRHEGGIKETTDKHGWTLINTNYPSSALIGHPSAVTPNSSFPDLIGESMRSPRPGKWILRSSRRMTVFSAVRDLSASEGKAGRFNSPRLERPRPPCYLKTQS